MTTPQVLRCCASYAQLRREDCLIPERCQERLCSDCATRVHYDPKASIPLLGQEKIICETCLDRFVQEMT